MQLMDWRHHRVIFFKNQTGVRYREIITISLYPELEDMDVDDIWFQKDDAICHTDNNKFNSRVISGGGKVNWPQRSCDLTP